MNAAMSHSAPVFLMLGFLFKSTTGDGSAVEKRSQSIVLSIIHIILITKNYINKILLEDASLIFKTRNHIVFLLENRTKRSALKACMLHSKRGAP